MLAFAGCYANGKSALLPSPFVTFGTMGRNIFRDTGFHNVDLSITKSFKFGERLKAQFRVETFNFLNHPNFAPPDGNLSSPYYGQSRSLGGLIVMSHGGAPTTYNRKIDLNLRFTF